MFAKGMQVERKINKLDCFAEPMEQRVKSQAYSSYSESRQRSTKSNAAFLVQR